MPTVSRSQLSVGEASRRKRSRLYLPCMPRSWSCVPELLRWPKWRVRILLHGCWLLCGLAHVCLISQLRDATPLTESAPPLVAPIFIPGCSETNAAFDCPLERFTTLVERLVDPHFIGIGVPES